MKKKALYVLSLAALTFIGCKGDYDDWAAPQGFEPEAAIEVSFSAAAASAIDLATVTTDSVTVFTPSVTTEAEVAGVSYQVVVDAAHTLAASAQGMVAVEELTTAVVDIYGRRPTARTLNAVVEAFVNIDGSSVKATSNVDIVVTPDAPVIESGYYLMVGTSSSSVLNNGYPFTHSGADVYDDPVFTVVVSAPIDVATGERVDMWFKIAPQSAIENQDWSVVWGCATDGDTSLTGNLVLNGGAMMQPATDGALYYSISANMLDGTYMITPMSFEEYIYVPGNHQSWNPATAAALHSPASDGIYTGFSYLDGGFKFTRSRENWDNEYNYNSFTTYNGDFSADGTNIVMGTPGYYYIQVDAPASTLTATLIERWGVIGDFNGWADDVPMTYDGANDCWSVTLDMTAGGFKFRANGDWVVGNYGGTSYDNLEENSSSNLTIEEAGTYTITLYASRTTSDNIYCTVVRQ